MVLLLLSKESHLETFLCAISLTEGKLMKILLYSLGKMKTSAFFIYLDS